MPFSLAVQVKKSNAELQADVVDYLKRRLQMGKGPVSPSLQALAAAAAAAARLALKREKKLVLFVKNNFFFLICLFYHSAVNI